MKRTSMMQVSKITSSKKSALEFLCKVAEEKGPIRCPECRTKRYWVLATGRLMCAECRFVHVPFAESWMGAIRIDFAKWLVLIKTFAVGLSARQAGMEADASYPTAHAAFDIMRRAILDNDPFEGKKLRGPVEEDESFFGGKHKGKRGRGAAGKVIVFGVKERSGRVSVRVVKNARASTLTKSTLKMVHVGSMVYTDKWKGYDALIYAGYRHKSVDHSKRFKCGAAHTNGIEGFWAYSKEGMEKYHGVSRAKFPLYIKEMEWRYNNRNEDIFMLLVGYMLT